MGDNKRVKRKFWPTRIYDYNYKVSEGYYKPQKNYMDTGSLDRLRQPPPKHQSYAERFAADPWYGRVKGLPYSSSNAALNEPLLKPSERMRGSSLVREMKDQEERDIPLNIRANRRRRRFEDEDEELGIRPRASRKQLFESTEQKSCLSPRYKDISEKLRSLDAELIRLAPRRTSVTETSYNTSPTRTSAHKSSRNEYSSYNNYGTSSTSKPPMSPRVRNDSFNDDFYQMPPLARGRVSSVGELPLIPRSRRSSINEDDDASSSYTTRATKIREERKLKESRDMTEGIHTMIEKMRAHRLNPEDGYFDRRDKGSRPHALDPRLREDQKAHSTFVYGVSGKY